MTKTFERLCKELRCWWSTDIRRDAARALGQLGDARAVEPLIQALGHSSNAMRKAVVRTLGQLGDDRAVEPLREWLGYEDCANVKQAL